MPTATARAPSEKVKEKVPNPPERERPQVEVSQPEVEPRPLQRSQARALPPANSAPPVARGAGMVGGGDLPVARRASMASIVQRQVGNAFIGRAGSLVQTKLRVSSPQDPAEQQAEQTAHRVMRMPAPTLQRACVSCEEATPVVQTKLRVSTPHDPQEREAEQTAQTVMRMPDAQPVVQRACAACEETTVQRAPADPAPAAPQDLGQRIEAERPGGAPLADSTRDFMEPRFGRSFEDVKVHTSPAANSAASSIGARAFTTGNDIFFASGEYQPGSSGGRELIAHELTHTIQQTGGQQTGGETESVVARAPATTVQEAVDIIVDGLQGYTSRWDSENILEQFQTRDGATARAILSGLKAKGPENDTDAPGMITWLFGDMTFEDARTLRGVLIHLQVTEDIRPMLAAQIVDLLEGYTSEDDSHEILEIIKLCKSTDLDNLLTGVEGKSGKNAKEMGEWLFGDVDRITAQRLRDHFYTAGGPHAASYAIEWTAQRVFDLLAGWTSGTDSSQIVNNFVQTPLEFRGFVYDSLDRRAQEAWREPAEKVLMEDMGKDDYETIRALGLPIKPYKHRRGFLDTIGDIVDWTLVIASWVVCGLVGIVTGIVSVILDLLGLLVDAGVAIYDLLGSALYLVSGGAAGSEQWFKVKNFFIGAYRGVTNPGAVWDAYWEEAKLGLDTIEGPLTDCRRAEYVVRKTVSLIVNILLIALAGYGLVKGAASGAKTLAQVARIIARVGITRAARMFAGRAARWIGGLATIATEAAQALIRLLSAPRATLAAIRLNVVRLGLAARDIDYWKAVRGTGRALLDSEREFWAKQKDYWSRRLGTYSEEHAALDDEAALLEAAAEEGVAPPEHASVKQQIEDDAAKLKDDVHGTERQMVGDPMPPDYLKWEETLSPETREVLRSDPELRRLYSEMDPVVRRIFTRCGSLCLPTKPRPSAQDQQRIAALAQRLGIGPEGHPGLQEYIHVNRSRLSAAIDDIFNVADRDALQERLEAFIKKTAVDSGGTATRNDQGRWVFHRSDGASIVEYELDSYGVLADTRGTDSFFQAHHGIQDLWGETRLPDSYSSRKGRGILLRDSHKGTPHRIISDRQAARKGTVSTRTYLEERGEFLVDMKEGGVPQTVADQLVGQSDAYFAELYMYARQKMTADELRAIFGDPVKLPTVFAAQ